MRTASLGTLLLLGSCSCNAFVGRYGPAFYEGTENRYFEKTVDAAVESAVDDAGFRVLLGPDEQILRSADGPECLGYPLVFRFAWLSDVQIRQREVKLFDDGTSRTLDHVIPSFEHHPVQDEFSWAAFLVQIVALNAAVKEGLSDPASMPQFLVHTGDAIDSGSIQEAFQFQHIADLSRIPWFNVLGNHDTAIFGNYEKRLTYTLDPGVEFYPVGRRGFLGMHRPAEGSAFGSGLLPVSTVADDSASLAGTYRQADGHLATGLLVPPSDCHGFDLLAEPASVARDASCPAPAAMGPTRYGGSNVASGCAGAPGRYAFSMERKGQRFRIVVLDTTKKTGWGADAELNGCDQRWVRGVLEEATEPTILLFGHHRPSRELDQAVIASGKADRVIYFSGHTHSHAFAPATPARPYPELNSGSIIEYPQLGRMVEIRAAGGRVCAITRAMWASYQGEKPDDLRTDPGRRPALERYVRESCEPNPAAARVPLSAAVRCSQYGAMLDFLAGRKRLVGRPQPFEEWWRAANVAVAIGGRKP